MRGVLLEVPESLLAERRTTGADRQDEMWDGVLHMNPPPRLDHQDFEYEFERWLRAHWKAASGGEVYHNVGVARPGRWPQDYRAPDLVLVGPERLGRLRETHLEGARPSPSRSAAPVTRPTRNSTSTRRSTPPRSG